MEHNGRLGQGLISWTNTLGQLALDFECLNNSAEMCEIHFHGIVRQGQTQGQRHVQNELYIEEALTKNGL